MNKSLIAQLQTPCLVINCETARQNVRRMQQTIDGLHCKLRPHIKTHKMPCFARLQMEMGACGITCAKVSEAAVMADAGITDIFIAYPIVGDFRIKRVLELSKRVESLIVAADSIECAQRLHQAAHEVGVTLKVRLEIDTGAKRTGVTQEHFVKTAHFINQASNLELVGIYTFKGLVYKGEGTMDPQLAGSEEGAMLHQAYETLKNEKIHITQISGGSSPTAIEVAKTGLVTEVRPGTYVFNDYMLVKEGACSMNQIAARFYATVVSTPADDYAVIDGGTKTFPTDVALNVEPYFYPGYAVVVDNENLQLTRMNEEHGILKVKNGVTGLKVGQVIELIPIHICTAINLQNNVYLWEKDQVRIEKVAARGMLI